MDVINFSIEYSELGKYRFISECRVLITLFRIEIILSSYLATSHTTVTFFPFAPYFNRDRFVEIFVKSTENDCIRR